MLNNLWGLGGISHARLAYRVRLGFGTLVATESDAVRYVGDCASGAPMFGFFRHRVGVSTVTRCLHGIETPPRWITAGPGASFVEVAEALLSSQVG